MSDTDIQQLIEDLGSKAGATRHSARRDLVKMGAGAVGALTAALSSPVHYTRWGAAKALGQIKDATSAAALVVALEDDESDVRWLAAIALFRLGDAGLQALLTAMAAGDLELHHHHAAHHVLHDFVDAGRADVVPVLAALETSSPKTDAPLAAAALISAPR
jgi:HEAT repeat protein